MAIMDRNEWRALTRELAALREAEALTHAQWIERFASTLPEEPTAATEEAAPPTPVWCGQCGNHPEGRPCPESQISNVEID